MSEGKLFDLQADVEVLCRPAQTAEDQARLMYWGAQLRDALVREGAEHAHEALMSVLLAAYHLGRLSALQLEKAR